MIVYNPVISFLSALLFTEENSDAPVASDSTGDTGLIYRQILLFIWVIFPARSQLVAVFLFFL